ncbi:hypothetical protein Adt_09577 [Abeliophyllum distichum]|uniref:Uncharacterized protein n=1 Tax=Abeliophyllum distichum TaxID=126358 RepID=A0ABD1UJ64_9LAMI
MTFESRLEYLSQVRSNFGSINLIQGSPQSANSYNGRGNRGGRNSNFRGRSRGRGRFGRSNEVRHPCQICGLSNHTAAWCYNMFDEKYMGKGQLIRTLTQILLPILQAQVQWRIKHGMLILEPVIMLPQMRRMWIKQRSMEVRKGW